MKARHWALVAEIAAAQDGLITFRQALAAGTSVRSFRREVSFGRLVPVRRSVYRTAALAPGPFHDIRAVVLANPKLTASHSSAAALWGLMHPGRPVHCTIPQTAKARLKGVVVHHADLAAAERAVAHGIPCTSPARTIVDLASVLPPDWVERLTHDAVMRGLCEYDDLAAVAERHRSAIVRAMLDGANGTTPIEVQWNRLLQEAGLPEPVPQHQVVVGEHLFVLDFAWPDAKVALEVDGFVAHRTRPAFDRDRAKVIALRAAGWEVVAVTAKTTPEPALALLRRLISHNSANSWH
jgi:very-short-patch-repair endonuclease